MTWLTRLRGVAAAAIILTGLQAAALAEASGSFNKTLTVSAVPDVEVTTGSGDITVRAGAGDKVTISARIKASNSWFNGSSLSPEERVKRIEENPPIKQNGNMISIGRIEEKELRQNVSISYEITVPAKTKLHSETGSGDQTIEDVDGPLRASTGSGNIDARKVGDGARLETGSGDVKVEAVTGRLYANTGSGNIVARNIAGGLLAETGSGDITYDQTAAGDVTARTGSGNVHLNNVKGSVEAHTGSGDVKIIGEARGNWEVHTGSGNVELQLPPQSGFEVNAESSSGEVTINRPITVQGTMKRNHLHGKVGAGGVLLSLETGSGDIRIN